MTKTASVLLATIAGFLGGMLSDRLSSRGQRPDSEAHVASVLPHSGVSAPAAISASLAAQPASISVTELAEWKKRIQAVEVGLERPLPAEAWKEAYVAGEQHAIFVRRKKALIPLIEDKIEGCRNSIAQRYLVDQFTEDLADCEALLIAVKVATNNDELVKAASSRRIGYKLTVPDSEEWAAEEFEDRKK